MLCLERESERERARERERERKRERGTSRPVAVHLTVLLGAGLEGCTGISRTTATGDSTFCGADKCVISDLRSECSFEYPACAQAQAHAQTQAQTEAHARAHAHVHGQVSKNLQRSPAHAAHTPTPHAFA